VLISLDRILERLDSFSQQIKALGYKHIKHIHAWGETVHLIEMMMESDDGTVWREERLNRLQSLLAAQVPIAASAASNASKLHPCFNLFGIICQSEDLTKRFQLAILLHTRSEEAAIRICALNMAQGLWENVSATGLLTGAYSLSFFHESSKTKPNLLIQAMRWIPQRSSPSVQRTIMTK
jgi:U3 small nucleolar RNA-associated protein 10